ncbi:MAG: hypothetical protein EXQ60_05800 [Candidatus Nanopelagicales bacterium]|nr:hypothetical protein [Candidatus Nanopelagicales bacterium]
MANTLPDAKSRFRCAHCGNLTRFDVLRSAKVSEFWHVDISGTPVVEETTVLTEVIDQVRCRWCAVADRIEMVPRPEFGGPSAEGLGDGGP